jgi:hypothetical protein
MAPVQCGFLEEYIDGVGGIRIRHQSVSLRRIVIELVTLPPFPALKWAQEWSLALQLSGRYSARTLDMSA